MKPATVNFIRRTRGLAAEIAAVAGVSEAYVSMVLSRKKPPSPKMISAIPVAVTNVARRLDQRAFEMEYPG
jgi:transcriptional regulator with XRE-family HTH domain